jgi:hypothetical protein
LRHPGTPQWARLSEAGVGSLARAAPPLRSQRQGPCPRDRPGGPEDRWPGQYPGVGRGMRIRARSFRARRSSLPSGGLLFDHPGGCTSGPVGLVFKEYEVARDFDRPSPGPREVGFGWPRVRTWTCGCSQQSPGSRGSLYPWCESGLSTLARTQWRDRRALLPRGRILVIGWSRSWGGIAFPPTSLLNS